MPPTAFVAALLLVLCGVSPALAHASLVATEPRDGSMVAQPPEIVRLRFNEPVTPVVVRVIEAQGKTLDAAVRSAGETVEITLPEGMPAGPAVVSYRVISADGHPVAGSMMFSVGMVKGTAAAPGDSDAALKMLIWLSRIGIYLGLFVGIGGAFFNAWTSRAGRKLVRGALLVGLCSALLSFGCQGLDLLGLPLGGMATVAPWQAASATTLGPSLMIAAAAMACSWLSLRRTPLQAARALSAVSLAGAGIALATSGHAATAPPQWLTRPMVGLHGAALAWWLGALLPLLVMTLRPEPLLLPTLDRFSRIALPVVGLTVLTGLVLAIIQVGSFHALVGSAYGWILCVKLALVVLLLALAALNRFRLTPALRSDRAASRLLVRSISGECVVVLGILALVAGWRFTPPPRALAAALRPPLSLHLHSTEAMFQVLVSPGRPGADDFVLQIMAGDASPMDAREVTLSLGLPERGIEPFERKAERETLGSWIVRDVPVPFAGRWRVRVDALVSDFQQVTLEDELDVPSR